MKCSICIDDLIKAAKSTPEVQQALQVLRNKIDSLPDAHPTTANGMPLCLFHYLRHNEFRASPLRKLLQTERERG